MASGPASALTLGLRANAGQFALLVGVSALVGGMVGQERAIVPLLGVAGLRPADGDRRAGVPRRLRADEGGHEPRRRAPWRTGSGESRSSSPAGSSGCRSRSSSSLAPDMGLGRRRQRPARCQPGADLVDDGPDEDRPRRSASARSRARAERGRRATWRSRSTAFLTGAIAAVGRAASRAVLPRDRDRRARARGVRRCSSARRMAMRFSESRAASRTPADRRGRAGSGSPGGARSPTGRCRPPRQAGLVNNLNDAPGLGAPADRLGRPGWISARSGSSRRPTRRPGASSRSRPVGCRTGSVGSA